MQTKIKLLTVGLFLAAIGAGFGQPVITTQPQSCTNAVGTTATFTVLATGTEPLAYQWQKYLTDWSDLTNCTDASLVLTNVQTSDDADYQVVVTNDQGAVTSAVAHLFVVVPPQIVRITNYDASVSVGATARMQVSVVAGGPPPLSLQWWFGGLPLAGKATPTLNLTNVQTTDAGFYTVVVTNLAGSVTSAPVSLGVDPTFTKIMTGAIVTDSKHWHGQAWGDYNNDGYLDVLILSYDSYFNPIYLNNGDGTFTRTNVPSLQGYTGSAQTWLYCCGDYDNDGHLDLFFASWTSGPNLLFHNNGNGTFTRITNAPIALEGGISTYGAWGDYNRDGYLDLFVANGAGPGSAARNWFYQNQGNGSFLKLTNDLVRPLVSELGLFSTPNWVDVDDDGWPDLFVTVGGTNRLFRNIGPGGFIKVSGDPLVSESSQWCGAAWADYDNDGDLDVFVPSGSGFDPTYTGPVALYRNDGAGHFTKMTTNDVGPLVSERVNSLSCAWGDYDNDGWIDLFVSNGYAETGRPSSRQCLLYRNNGDGTFTKITTGSLANEWGDVIAANWVDYDNDGFLDLFETTHPNSDGYVNRLFRNNGNSNSWLCVKCVGTSSPRWGTGAKVRAKATIRGKEMSQLRLIDAGGSSWGGQSFVAHFGLGDATNVDVLRIEWTSGVVQELHNVPVKQYLTVTEPAKLSMAQAGQLKVQCWKGMAYRIDSSPDLATWTPLATVTNRNLTGGIQWTDPAAPGPATRFYRAVKQ